MSHCRVIVSDFYNKKKILDLGNKHNLIYMIDYHIVKDGCVDIYDMNGNRREGKINLLIELSE